MRAFSEITGVPLSIYRRDMSLAKFSPVPQTPYCTFVHRTLSRCKTCLASDRDHMQKARSIGAPLWYRCHAGLQELVVPIHCENSIIGFAKAGKVRTSDSPPRSLVSACGPNVRTKAIRYFRAAPLVTSAWQREFAFIYSVLIENLIARKLVRVVHSPVVEELLAYITDNCAENISVKTLAHRFFMSRSTVSRLFRKHVGQRVKDFIVGTRVANAEMMIQTHPEHTLRAIASACGFSDQFAFSKVFKRIRHLSPITYRRKFAP